MSLLPDFTQLLAIGLLNLADDEGYFNANPALIKAALFPLRECSRSITVGLQALSDLEFLRIYKVEDGRTYGWIVKFKSHQVINKPIVSKIKPLCNGVLPPTVLLPDNSGTPPVVLRVGMEQGMEQGTGNREGEGEMPVAPLPEKTSQLGLLPTEQPTEHERRLLLVNEVVGRKSTTRWGAKEVRAYKAAGLDRCPTADFNEQLELTLAYYGAQVAALRPFWGSQNDGDFRRRTLLTLLNNWAGEVDRAGAWRQFQSKNNEQRGSARL